MKTFSQVILGFSAASLILGAVYMLRPSGKMEKSVKFAFSVIFLSVIIAAFAGLLKINTPFSVKASSADLTETAEAVTKYRAEYLCEALLKENGINFNKILVNTDISADGSIGIKRVTVFTNNTQNGIKELILSAVMAREVEVINE